MQNWHARSRVHAKPLYDKPVAAIATRRHRRRVEPLRAKHEDHARHRVAGSRQVLREARTAGLRSGENPATAKRCRSPRRKKNSVRHHPAMPYETVPAFVAALDMA